MKSLYYEEKDPVRIFFPCDVHLGARGADRTFFEGMLEQMDGEDVRFIGLGDYHDAIWTKDPRCDVYSMEIIDDPDTGQRPVSILEIQEQVYEYLNPFKHKCYGLLDGNHENEFRIRNGQPIVSVLAKRLGVEYLGLQGIFRVNVRGRMYAIFCVHGGTTASTDTGRANAMKRYRDIAPECDIFAVAHYHSQQTSPDSVFGLDGKERYRLSFMCGGFLEGYSGINTSYIQKKSYPPLPLGYPILELDGGTPQISYVMKRV